MPLIANPDFYHVSENGTLVVPAGGFLTNDFSSVGSLSATLITDNVDHGVLQAFGDGHFNYTPDAGFNGIDTFSYRVGNGIGSVIGTVTIMVFAPTLIATPDAYVVVANGTLAVPASGFLTNDVSQTGTLAADLVINNADHGTLAAFGDGHFNYTPNSGFTGTDSFSYRVTDGVTKTIGDVTIIVTDASTSAMAPDFYAVAAGQSLVVAAAGFLGNDYTATGTLTATLITDNVDHGTLTAFPDGHFNYTPDPGFVGEDSFVVRTNDGVADFSQTVTINVFAHQDPVANPDYYHVETGGSLTVSAAEGLLVNDFDPDGGTITAILVTDNADHGVLSVFGDGHFTYNPFAGFAGIDTFVVKIENSFGLSAEETITVAVTLPNDPPVASSETVFGNQKTAISGTVHATDLDSPSLTFTKLSDPAHGSLAFDSATGAFTYTPDPTFVGNDTFTFTANDGLADSAVATTTLHVSPVQPAGTAWESSPDYGVRTPPFQVAGVGDFNHDGTDDVLWRDPTTGAVDEWTMQDGQWQKSTSLGSHGTDWTVAGIGDFNHDGTDDVLWRNTSTGAVDAWTMQDGQWQKSTSLGSHGTDWTVAGIGDFNHDGTDDVLWRNTSTGAIDEWQMKDGQWFASVNLGSHGTDWTVAGVGDFDHDGTSDILFRNSQTGQLDEWRMNDGQWTASVDLGNHGGLSWQVGGVGDFNQDGTADIFWHDTASGANDVWNMFNGAYFSTSTFGPFDTAYVVAGIGNFNDADGDDVLWRNPTSGQTSGWLLAAA
jgi:hypothetical protein